MTLKQSGQTLFSLGGQKGSNPPCLWACLFSLLTLAAGEGGGLGLILFLDYGLACGLA